MTCPHLSTRQFRAARSSVALAPLLIAMAIAALCPGMVVAQADDPMKQHYQAASQAAQSGDRQHAGVEYKAFLAEALHRAANGKADAGQFSSAVALYQQAVDFSPADQSLKFDYANACFDADQLVQARSLAQEVADSPGADRAARLLLGRVLFHLGEFDPARQQLEKVFAEKPEFSVGYLLAKTYLLLHKDPAAHDLLQGMAQNFGDTAENHVYFGRAYSETDHPDEAIAEFHRAMAMDPRAPNAHYYLALTYLGHNEAAGYAQAVPELHAELQLSPNDFRSHYMLGYIALQQRNFPEAEKELLLGLAQAPRDLESLLRLAEVYNATNRSPQAEEELRKAISLAANNPENLGQASRAHYLLGRILEKTGRAPEAQQEMRTVAEIQKRLGPSSMQAAAEGTGAVTAGRTTKEVKDDPKADVPPEKLAQLTQFITALKPEVADAYNNLGALSAEGNDFTAAVKYFQQAGEWDPSLPGLDRNLGMALYYSAQFVDAVPPLHRRVQTQPDDLAARSMLAMSLYRTGDFRRVIEALQPVSAQISADRALTAAYSDSYYQLGRFQLEANQTDAAIATLEAGAKVSPQDPAFHSLLAQAYRRAGRDADAQREEKALPEFPGPQPQ
jgi:tetratricopeptide (TPR) repeat protein